MRITRVDNGQTLGNAHGISRDPPGFIEYTVKVSFAAICLKKPAD
jgi:hypothetical protein